MICTHCVQLKKKKNESIFAFFRVDALFNCIFAENHPIQVIRADQSRRLAKIGSLLEISKTCAYQLAISVILLGVGKTPTRGAGALAGVGVGVGAGVLFFLNKS